MKVSYIGPEVLTVAVLGHIDPLNMFFLLIHITERRGNEV